MNHYSTLEKARLAKKHYENFPVATLFLKKKYHDAISILYYFARSGDDIADEGNLTKDQRLALLNEYQSNLNKLKKHNLNVSPLFLDINKISKKFKIKLILYEKFINAFKQDVTKKRYKNFMSLKHYLNNAACPAGELILTIFKKNNRNNISYSNQICYALALIGIIQDLYEDMDKGRLYIPLNEMKKFNLKISDIKNKKFTNGWRKFNEFWVDRIEALIKEGSPLKDNLRGSLRLQIKILIKAAEFLIFKMRQDNYNLFKNTHKLRKIDWLLIFCRCILTK